MCHCSAVHSESGYVFFVKQGRSALRPYKVERIYKYKYKNIDEDTMKVCMVLVGLSSEEVCYLYG